MKKYASIPTTLLLIIMAISPLSSQDTTLYDIVINNGRVIDPETQLDAIRNVAIKGDRIVDITQENINGKQIINAKGLVVAPGFIDIHVHGMTPKSHEYQVKDGVTTALELESGRPFLRKWLASKKGKTIVNYGASVPHGFIRTMAMDRFAANLEAIQNDPSSDPNSEGNIMKVMANMTRSSYQSLEGRELTRMKTLMNEALFDGALGIGVPVGYYPGATHGEIFEVYDFAAKKQVIVFSHTRGFGMPGIQEAISNATTTGASLHIVHANSLSLSEIDVTLKMVESAQKNGLDITTEVYPYTAASTSLGSVLFDEGWQEELGISYQDLQWEATGERLNKITFEKYRAEGGVVIIHMMKPEWVQKGIASDITLIASDGMPYAPKAHPRSAGTFSRVLGRYVREQKVIELPKALKKMTLMPAMRLEKIAPAMRLKGRLQVGMDADITIFDPQTVIDRADFKGLQYSEGIIHVVINGQLVVHNQNIVRQTFPGRPIYGRYRN